jgi:sugar phosphate permease
VSLFRGWRTGHSFHFICDSAKAGLEAMSEALNLIQWAAFALSLLAAWLVASTKESRRNIGFWVFLVSNAAWTVWGVHTAAYALIALQICLAVLNVRGLSKTKEQG